MRLLSGVMAELSVLRPLMNDIEANSPSDTDRAVVERLVSALWGVFSHHRAVVDRTGRHYDLGSWRAAAELIADLANRRYPTLNSPIRYMDCYMGVLLGEDCRPESQPLHRWVFAQLRAAGCDWIYAFSPDLPLEERRARARQRSAALTDPAFLLDSRESLPAVVWAYRAVYGRMPEGWPT